MESTSQETGRDIANALRIAETRRERKRVARKYRERMDGKPLASDIRATFERGDWS